MKFAGGYLLGAVTIVGLGISFCGGIVACDYVYKQKNQTAQKITDASVADMMIRYFKEKEDKK